MSTGPDQAALSAFGLLALPCVDDDPFEDDPFEEDPFEDVPFEEDDSLDEEPGFGAVEVDFSFVSERLSVR